MPALALCGCSTLAGLPVSPVTGSAGAVLHSECTGWDRLWGWPLGFATGLIWGPVMEVSIGLSGDMGCLGHGAYGEAGNPRFTDVFDPYGYALEPAPAAPRSTP